MQKSKELVSVIVLNWNGQRFLKDCLGTLLKQDYPNFEVLLVDNGSTDSSIEFARKMFGDDSKLKIVALPKNYGFSKGNNIGVRFAKGKYIVILNNDTIVQRDLIASLVKEADRDDNVGCVGCKILTANGDLWFSQKFSHSGFIVPIFLQNLVKNRVNKISNYYSTNLANSGCACLFKKHVFQEIGGYDEDFLADWEDWDLGYRLNIAGYRSVYLPQPLVYHIGGGSFGYPPSRYVRIYRNNLYSYFKNYETKNFYRFFIFAFFLLPISHFGFFMTQFGGTGRLKRGQILGHFFALPNAYWLFLNNLRVFTRKRFLVQKTRKASDNDIFKKTSAKSLA